MSQAAYGWMDYKLDTQLISGFTRLQESYSKNPVVPWGLEARTLLERRRRRVRTGPGHMATGRNASFSRVSNYRMVTDSQVYAVLVKEVDAAKLRVQEFRQINQNVSRDSPLERIVCAIHIAETDRATAKKRDLTYTLGLRLLALPRNEQARAKKRTVGYGLYQTAVESVQPVLF